MAGKRIYLHWLVIPVSLLIVIIGVIRKLLWLKRM